MIPTLAELAEMPGSAVLEAIQDELLTEAQRVRGVEEFVRPGAWDEDRAGAHHALCAAAEVIGRLRALGEEAKARGKTPAYAVQLAADVGRSALILELQQQRQQPIVTGEDTDEPNAA
jgi:hypothetical protein